MFEILRKNKAIAVFIAFLIVGLAVYANSFGNKLFWDDDDLIVNNVYVHDFKVGEFFTQNEIAGVGQSTNYYRPLLLVSFALDYQLWGLAPFGYHLTNTLLHILAAWLVFILLYSLLSWRADPPRLARGEPPLPRGEFLLAFLPALFFLIHPLQTEAVAYAAGRADPLSTVLLLLSLLFYVSFRFNKKGWPLAWSLIFFAAALLVKEQAILLPALVLLVEAVFFIKNYDKKNILAALKLCSGFLVIAAFYLALRLTALNFNNIFGGPDYDLSSVYNQSAWSRLFTFCLVLLSYFKLLFLPAGLHMAREVAPVVSFFSWPVLSFLLLALILFFVCRKTWKENRLITFGWLWFFIILLPRTNILKINRPMYEHWLYLPLAGFYLALFCLILMLFDKIKNRKAFDLVQQIFYVMLIAYAVFLGALTIERNRDWRDPITFYENNLKYTPNSYIQHNNLGMAYDDAGRIDEAIAEYQKAIAIKDVYPQVHYNLGSALVAAEKYPEAEAEYKKAIAMDPGFILPKQNLYNLYIYLGEKDKAEEILKSIK